MPTKYQLKFSIIRFINDKLVLNNAWDLNRNISIVNSNFTGGYVLFDLSLSSGISNLRPYARVKYNSSKLLELDTIYDGSENSSSSSNIIYKTPSNFESIISLPSLIYERINSLISIIWLSQEFSFLIVIEIKLKSIYNSLIKS